MYASPTPVLSTAEPPPSAAFSNSGGSNILSTGSSKSPGSVFSGWVPVFDTMHGIRGEVNVSVKIELFNDFNKFRQSSCGVQFFYSKYLVLYKARSRKID